MILRKYLIALLGIVLLTTLAQAIVINEFMSSNSNSLYDSDGDTPDWIELYNNSDTVVNLSNFFLSDKPGNPQKWRLPACQLLPNDFKIIFCSGKNLPDTTELHSNFKIESSGEYILLSHLNGTTIELLPPVSLQSDRSYGLLPDGGSNYGMLSRSSPGNSNNASNHLTQITFSKPSGFYASSFNLEMQSTDTIYYTLDGSLPTPQSTRYMNGIHIAPDPGNKISLIPTTYRINYSDEYDYHEYGFQPPQSNTHKASIIRVQAFRNGEPTTPVYNKTYFTEETHYSFPVISLITDSLNLFDYHTGLFITGAHFNPEDEDNTGNYFQRGSLWERQGNIEMFDSDGASQFNETIGFRISGFKSRTTPQKSLRIYFRSEYGKSKLSHPLFEDRDYDSFKRFVLRSSFTYWFSRNSLFQDDLLHQIVATGNMHVDMQMSTPALLFINGEYWGVQNIRERQDKYYLNALHQVALDSIHLINGNLATEEGSNESFQAVLDYLDIHDLTEDEHYFHIAQQFDMTNYLDYFISEIYFGNVDWPNNNLKLWKTMKEGSQWEYLLFDLDATLSDPATNTFEHIASINNDAQATLFMNFMKNAHFRSIFVDRYLHHLQTTFHPTQIFALIDQYEQMYEPEIEEHIQRWGNPPDKSTWQQNCQYLTDYFTQRPCHIKEMLINTFHLEDLNEFDCHYIDENLSKKDFELFPNPCSDWLTIYTKAQHLLPGYIEIYDLQGKLKKREDIAHPIQQFDVSNLLPGIYTLIYHNPSDPVIRKLSIVR